MSTILVWIIISLFHPILFIFSIPEELNHHPHHKVSNNASHINVLCESPSLPHGSVHIVVAGHNPGDFKDHYLVQSGLTNARIIFYNREGDVTQIPPQVNGSCGIIAVEKMLTPNYGREGTAFYDYAIEHYDKPPKMMVFLHGHAFVGLHPHNTCLGSFSRILHFYRSISSNNSFSRMITLTQKMPKSQPFTWKGALYDRRRRLSTIQETQERKRTRRLEEDVAALAAQECVHIFVKNNVTARAPGTIPYYDPKEHRVQFRRDIRTDGTSQHYMRSCCSTFIMNGDRLRWYPLQFYRDMKAYFVNKTINEQAAGWTCFEFVIWDLYADQRNTFGNESEYDRLEPERRWYDDANKLSIHTKNSVLHGTALQKFVEEEREAGNTYFAAFPNQDHQFS